MLGSDFSGVTGYTVVTRAEARTVCLLYEVEPAARGRPPGHKVAK